MNETFHTILERRSIRKYEDRKIPNDLIQDLLRAAMSAPSACNQQPWHFIVVEDKKLLSEISEIHSGYNLLKDSPLMIVICGEPKATILECYWEQDCSAATENILIAAQGMGLGGVWLGINPRTGEHSEIISKILNIPDHIRPFSMVSIGYPAKQKEPANRFDSNRIHYNMW